ncbi:hypothetical protein VTK73DRAFT_1458 [Phialemonium thermophilum]|uniref:Uncharacterized protein n=1 Tax=Phialemonium thermophilum TaxID=223376 RepID=A0ABR3VTE4_9PEZI
MAHLGTWDVRRKVDVSKSLSASAPKYRRYADASSFDPALRCIAFHVRYVVRREFPGVLLASPTHLLRRQPSQTGHVSKPVASVFAVRWRPGNSGIGPRAVWLAAGGRSSSRTGLRVEDGWNSPSEGLASADAEEGGPQRSVFKLEELIHLYRTSSRLDLAATPGSMQIKRSISKK